MNYILHFYQYFYFPCTSRNYLIEQFALWFIYVSFNFAWLNFYLVHRIIYLFFYPEDTKTIDKKIKRRMLARCSALECCLHSASLATFFYLDFHPIGG